ncbi:MAG TPA: FtsX-like permease family protein [Nitrolancea sp.]|nr:FtsX-like permease family protein [Nitrolancea sp.]
MNSIFGISTTNIMIALLILFGVFGAIILVVLIRNPVVFKLGVRNIPRRPAQTILIVIGLMLSTLIIAAAFTTGDTLSSSIRGQVLDISGQTDERVVLASGTTDTGPQTGAVMPETIVAELEAKLQGNGDIAGLLPVLSESVPTIDTRTKLSEPGLTLTGVDPARLAPFGGLKTVDGKPIDLASLPVNDVVLSKTAADKIDAQVGDTLTVFAQNQPHQLRVNAIAPDSYLTGYTQPGSSGGFAIPLGQAQALLGYPGQISAIEVTNHGGVDSGVRYTDSAMKALDTALAGTSYQAIPTKQNDLKSAESLGNVFMTLFIVFGLFSISVGILLIFLIFVMLAAERKPELGMARAVGMKRRQLTEMFLAEGIAYDLLSALVGAALGVGVAFVIAGFMGRLIGQFFAIHPSASWRSLVIAYTLGVVVTFLTIIVSSWRVSRLNIVEAIRDVPEPQLPRAGRSWLIFGILGALFGLLLLWIGAVTKQSFPFSLGISLIPLGLAGILRRFGVPARPLYTVAALLVLTYWLLPSSISARIFPELTGGLEMFFLSGIMMVAAATVAIIWNVEAVTWLVSLLGRASSRWVPAVRTAVAYPMERKGRTGMTIAMFSLVIFALVMMATINSNAYNIILGSEYASGGWDIQASQSPTNPIPDFTTALSQAGVDTNTVAATGRFETIPSSRSQIRLAGDEVWKSYTVNGADVDFINNSRMPLQTRALGYTTDQAVWNAVRDNPDLAIVDAGAVPNPGSFQIGAPSFKLTSLKPGYTTMEPVKVEIADPATGATKTVTIIGVLDSQVATFPGVWMSEQSFGGIFTQPQFISYDIRLKPGVDSVQMAKTIESALVTYGVQADAFKQVLKDATSQSQGILTLIEGFMMLGLVVGIAALGVITFRSVVERRQQIGMLRAIGYQRSMVAVSFLIESTMITLLGVLSGAILGLLLARKLVTSDYFIGTSTSVNFTIPWLDVVVFVVLAVAASLLLAYIPARQAARVPIAQALRYE